MKKMFLIGWKDVTLAFRDRAALILMLAAPFLLTLGLGFVTGRFSGSNNTGLSNIPLIVVNQDEGPLGDQLVALFQSEDLAELVEPDLGSDPAAARQAVDEDDTAAAVIIPAGFTGSVVPSEGSAQAGPLVAIEVYTNPTRPTSSGVIRTIVEQYLARVEVARVGGQVAVAGLIASGRIQPQQAAAAAAQFSADQADQGGEDTAITLNSRTVSGETVEFDILAYMAPGMALMFLMYATTNGGRSLLSEKRQGTLPRLLVAPVSNTQVLGGKVLGIYLTGVAQMLILIGASTLFFQLDWGDPLGVVVLVLSAVAGAVGWGMIITALARTPGQVSAIGSAVMLTFGVLGGSFINLDSMPQWFRLVNRITPNAWGLDGFAILAQGGRLGDILDPILGLWIMGALLFILAVALINRRGLVQR